MEGKQGKLHKVGEWFKKNYALLCAPLLVGALYLLALIAFGTYPFGDKYTAASYDLSAQIAPFIEHLFDVFDGKSTLSFSYAVVGGADLTGTFLYFFISPFSLLFLIFGDGKVAHAASVVMFCKLLAISFAGAWFAKRLFKNIPEYFCLAVGVIYAYCGYTFVANTYINWLDFLIYLPFCVWAFVRFAKTGKFFAFSLLVACNIYTCFSIACFSLFTVFPTLIAYAIFCVKREERSSFIAHLCLAFVVAILLALPVLLPALGSYSVSARGGNLFENLWKGFTLSEGGSPNEFNSSAFLDSYANSLYAKWSYIVADSLFVLLTLAWFLRRGLRDGFAKFMLTAGILTLLPVLVDESMNLLNMGSYMSYALRFGFLNSLYFLGGACLFLEEWCPCFSTPFEEKGEMREGGRYAFKRVYEKKNLFYTVGLCAFVSLIVAFLIWFTVGENYEDFLKLFGIESNSFSSVFAHSLGGLEVITVLFLAVGLVMLVGGLLVRGKKASPRLLSILLLVVVGVQVCFYNNQLVLGNRSTQHQTLGDYQRICAALNSRETGYFRVKDYDDELTACAPFTGNSNSFSVFSSVIDEDNFATFQLFGYAGNGKNTFKSAHNDSKKNRSDEFGDSFLGYKYFVSTKNDLHTQGSTNSYVKPVYVKDEEGNDVHLREGKLFAYENTIVFPLGYKVEGSYSFTVENKNNSINRKLNQQALYEYLRGEDLEEKTGYSFVTPSSAAELSEYLHTKGAEVAVSAGKITAKVSATAGESLLLNFVAAKGYSVTVNGRKAKLVDNDLKFLLVELDEGENEVIFTYTSPYGKQALLGLAVGAVGLLAVWFVVKRTKITEKAAPVIAWAGIGLALAVFAFFMLFPTTVFCTKIIELIKLWLS